MNETQVTARPYFRTPSISPDGSQVAFVYADDIWLIPIAGGEAQRLTANPAGHSWPRWSPDGSQIAFTSNRSGANDIYRLPLRSAFSTSTSDTALQRVTFHESASLLEAWSPDGMYLFFRSGREQQDEAIYRVAVTGGTPTLWISQPYETIGQVAISPDGQLLAFNLARDWWWRRGPNPYGGAEIWLVSDQPNAADYRKLSDAPGLNRWPMWAADGQGLYFVSDRDGIENIWFQPLEGGAAAKVTNFKEGRLLWPTISHNGNTIVFERDFTIWRLDVPSGAVRELNIQVHGDTRIRPAQVQTYRDNLGELELAPDGKKVAFVVRGEVFADFADKETDKDQRNGPAFRVTSNAYRDSDVGWSPDSRRLVYISDRHGDEEVYSYDFVSRTETRLTDSPRPKHHPSYSRDGAWLAYARGEDEIRLINTATSEDRLLVRTQFMYSAQFHWAPDSNWLVFIAQDERWFSNLYVQRIDEQTPRQITFLSNMRAHSPIWSPDGRFIIFTNEGHTARVDLCPPAPFFREAEFEKLFEPKEPRTENQEPKHPSQDQQNPNLDSSVVSSPSSVAEGDPLQPGIPQSTAPHDTQPATDNGQRTNDKSVEIIFEGIERRLRFVTPLSMETDALCISPDSRDLIFNAAVGGKWNLWTVPLDEPRQDQPPRQLTFSTSRKSAAQFAPEGKSFYFLDNGQIIIRKFPSGDQTAMSVYADVTIDFNQDKRQMFDESWRLLRDYFYDPTFRGLDWSEARRQFAPLAAGAQTYGELLAILNLMVGELRASHLGAYPPGGAPGQQGYLGLLFDHAQQAATGRLRVVAVIPDSPAALADHGAGIGVGEELLAVNGVELGPEVSLDRLLQRTVGRRVLLRLAPPAGGTPRELAVRPINAGAYRAVRYRAWVYANEAYVHSVSGGRLGYVHIRAMDYDSYQQFLADLDSEAYSKAGVVVDARFNGGGYVGTFILDILARRSVLLSTFRDRPPIDAGYFHGNRVLDKPTILVINEGSGSNTEMFAESYRRLGLGKVVGRPSAGAVIGTLNYRLIDDTMFRLPRIKIATPEGEDLEGTGRTVDIDVSLPLGEWARGVDRQLDAAVAALLAQIDGT